MFEGKPDMHVILPTALEIASALEYLHSNNVLHGARLRSPVARAKA